MHRGRLCPVLGFRVCSVPDSLRLQMDRSPCCSLSLPPNPSAASLPCSLDWSFKNEPWRNGWQD